MSDRPQLRMTRPNLRNLPPIRMPEGFQLSAMQPGWGEHWTTIIAESFNEPREKFGFEDKMGSDPAFSPERIFFAVSPEGVPIAVAAAWHKPAEPRTGIVHYVGALKAWQGNRLGYWVTLKALHHMVEEKRERAILLTDDFRLAAIKTYLKLGFEPDLDHASYPDRWLEILTNLNLPEPRRRYVPC